MNTVKKILVVEDDELMIKILEFIILKEGYSLVIARNGIEAIDNLEKHKPDMVITDIMLPYKSGLEVISYAKQNYANIPVIAISALGGEERTVVEAFELGVDDFISKPFNPNELILRVKRSFALKL